MFEAIEGSLTWSSFSFPTEKYDDDGCAMYSPDTEAAGDIASPSVKVIPVLAATSITFHKVSFSVWSG